MIASTRRIDPLKVDKDAIAAVGGVAASKGED